MQYQPLFILDRFGAGTLHAQLLSSQTSGSFQIDNASALGSQLATMGSGLKTIVTIENEQILCSGFSVSGSTVTCTIDTRGYNGTSAATHALGTVVEGHWTKAHSDRMLEHLNRFDDDGLLLPLSAAALAALSITNAAVHSVAGIDVTAYFTPGRVYLFKIGSTWYRSVVRSSSFSTNTTINITGDALPSSGTIATAGFEFGGPSTHAAVDFRLCKEAAANPTQSPPSGYSWLFIKSGNWYSKDSSGAIRFLTPVRATASSSSGVLTLDWSVANVYDCTLTENVTGVTHQNGVEGSVYRLRIKQHASSAKTVVLGTPGGTRFSNTNASYAMTTDLSAIDELSFLYHGTDTKYDLTGIQKGFQASPTQFYPTTARKVILATRDLSTASGNQNITHGLGGVPNWVRIVARTILNTNGSIAGWSDGAWDGTNTGSVYTANHNGGTGSDAQTDASNIINIMDTSAQVQQTATISVDGTNIILAWTKNGSATGLAKLMIECGF